MIIRIIEIQMFAGLAWDKILLCNPGLKLKMMMNNIKSNQIEIKMFAGLAKDKSLLCDSGLKLWRNMIQNMIEMFTGLAWDESLLRNPGSQNESLLQTKFSMEQFLPPQVKFITWYNVVQCVMILEITYYKTSCIDDEAIKLFLSLYYLAHRPITHE